MSDKTGFISADELIAMLNISPSELAEAVAWVRCNFGIDTQGG